MKLFRTILAPLALGLAIPAVALASIVPGTSDRGIVPTTYPGNFVSSDDDQVCYDMAALGYIGPVTSEMYGLKVDPPVDFSNDYLTIIIYASGRKLAWESQNATVLAFIIKGGPNYNVYDYVGSGFTYDSGLVSPLHRGSKSPQISHYNVCYEKHAPEGDQGCTPGYWRNHADRWAGVAPGDDFDSTFGVDLFTPDITLGTAIWLGGGGANALARHATAALLNAYGGVPNTDGTFVNYPYTAAQVIQLVQDAVANDMIEEVKDLLDAANNLGCPLSGTRAVPVG
jgi:hypothetical protein